jgi:hypothetical protein
MRCGDSKRRREGSFSRSAFLREKCDGAHKSSVPMPETTS